ncbi:MAG: hypothetical protein ACO1RA_02200 [Planctomycetaceae bacterium]
MSYAYWPLPALFGARRPKDEFDVVDRPVDFADILKKKQVIDKDQRLAGKALAFVNSLLLDPKYWKTTEHGWISVVVPTNSVLLSPIGRLYITIERLRETYRDFRVYESGHNVIFEPSGHSLALQRANEQLIPPAPPAAGMSFDAG